MNHLIHLSRKFRKAPTKAENLLWIYLRNKQLFGYKFRRQYAIYRYIVDFVCCSNMLIVELDGEIHSCNLKMQYDQLRTKYLSSLGYKELHFANEEVLTDIQYVLKKIYKSLI